MADIQENESKEVTNSDRNRSGQFAKGNQAKKKAADAEKRLAKKHKVFALKLATDPKGRKALKDLRKDAPDKFFSHVEKVLPKEVYEQKETEIRVVFPEYMLSSVDKLALKDTEHEVIELEEDDAGDFSQVSPIRETGSSKPESEEV